MDRYDPKYMDAEERELVKDLKKINARTLKKPTSREQLRIRRAAKGFVQNESKMNIRIAQSELTQIKDRARKEGLKYQTFVKSILHKYVTGQLVERSQKVG
jgi:predicted DNA binding CopG/RHH family protein